MRALILLTALLTPWLSAPAAAQDADRVAEERHEEELIEEDRVLSGQLVVLSGQDPVFVQFRTELRILDQRLRRHQRPGDSTAAGIGLIVPGGLGVVGGVVLLLVGALSSGWGAAVCGVSTGLGSPCTPRDYSDYFVAGGIALGIGVTVLVAGLVVALAGRGERAAFDRRDEMREELRLRMSASLSPTGEGAVLVASTFF